jgi:hypothetical protein
MTNDIGVPLLTADQIAVELMAKRLLGDLSLQSEIAEIGREFREKIPHGPRTAQRFEHDYRQTVFNALLGVANSDSGRPRVHAVNLFPHRIDDLEIPGTRALHSNPDYVYRFVPVDGAGRYVLRGERPVSGPLAFEISLMGEGQATLANLSLSDLVIAPDGTFAVTIDPDDPNGRPNHLQSRPGARQLVIRDIFDRIETQRPMALAAERLDPPAGNAPTFAELAASAGPAIRGVVNGLAGMGMVLKAPPNTLPQPAFSNQNGTLMTQAYSIGHFRLADDEGLLIRMTLGTAVYAVVPVTNFWGGVGDFLNHRTSVGTPRAEMDPDGAYTFVVSPRDPGIFNWVDTNGLDEGIICARWVGFRDELGPKPAIEARVMRVVELAAELPPGTPRCSPQQRQAQLAAHLRDYSAW